MIYYVGGFPPPYGGVTVKNALLYSMLYQRVGDDIRKIDTQRAKKNPFLLLNYVTMLLFNKKNPLVVATAGRQRRNLTLFLNAWNKKILRKSVLIVMGGNFPSVVKNDDKYVQGLSQYKEIYVETDGMIQALQGLGLNNVSLYPNCRKEPQEKLTVNINTGEPLKCVFFSLINREKGADNVLTLAKRMPDICIDFWGVLQADYREEFLKELESVSNATYRGIFEVKGENVYKKLNEYDVLILPTKHVAEGVPGVLIESKIAALPAIVSDFCYNAEIVEHGVSGIVLEDNTVEGLVDSVNKLRQNSTYLCRLKEGALRSSEKYYPERYVADILSKVTEKNKRQFGGMEDGL